MIDFETWKMFWLCNDSMNFNNEIMHSIIAIVTTKIKYNPQRFWALWKRSFRRNVRTAKSLTSKCPYGELSSRRSVPTAKCAYGKVSVRRSVRTTKCPYGEMSYGVMSNGEKSYCEKSGHGSEVPSLYRTIYNLGRKLMKYSTSTSIDEHYKTF